MAQIKFLDKNGTFIVDNPDRISNLYFPIAGEKDLKSSIAPNLAGDSKTDQNHFLLEPVSVENLHNNRNARNFWCRVEGKGYWSACGNSAEQEFQKFTDEKEETTLEAGLMWQKVSRESKKYGMKADITSFVTLNGAMEVMMVELINMSDQEQTITPIAAIPVYGRSADNLRDHRHVTSLLHRINMTEYGVITTPVLSFDERGHQKNSTSYFVCGSTGEGEKPEQFYPTVEEFIGDGGTFLTPEAVRENKAGKKAFERVEGKEAMGGIQFKTCQLKANESVCYIVLAGISENVDEIEKEISLYRNKKQVEDALKLVKEHWVSKVNVDFEMQDDKTDNYMKWICFQPILRRIYGCSFLPYHDYGKGGRGWRDLWQDCLALLIMEPFQVRQMIVDNYGGVRVDGTNATIIGNKQGEFIADRNNIARVWMDHGFWPFVTTKLYIDQTGDIKLLLEEVPYFKDRQVCRGSAHDDVWTIEEGNKQKTANDEIYSGSILEHILLQNLCAFYDVGEHNEIRLHGADWNDAIDMAWERGESVAFTCAYAENMRDIAEYLGKLEEAGVSEVALAEEMLCLFDMDQKDYESIEKKQGLLKEYTAKCQNKISGKTACVKTADVKKNFEEKAEWLMSNIRNNEWLEDAQGNGWFNGYYDNNGRQVEGVVDGNVRMMLTSQVFAIMSGTATEEQVAKICKSADQYLYEKKAGGYRLNTNFHEEKFDMGRMFGFAYGEKENGAVFSHMTVMYANALYKRGFVKEGHKVMQTLLETAMDFENSKMYPGLPEYFDNDGHGLYAYLTGAASWYMLTMIAEVFGVYGEMGDLVVEPKLVADQFDAEGNAALKLTFAGKQLCVKYKNAAKKTFGDYQIEKAFLNGTLLDGETGAKVRIMKEQLEQLDDQKVNEIEIVLA